MGRSPDRRDRDYRRDDRTRERDSRGGQRDLFSERRVQSYHDSNRHDDRRYDHRYHDRRDSREYDNGRKRFRSPVNDRPEHRTRPSSKDSDDYHDRKRPRGNDYNSSPRHGRLTPPRQLDNASSGHAVGQGMQQSRTHLTQKTPQAAPASTKDAIRDEQAILKAKQAERRAKVEALKAKAAAVSKGETASGGSTPVTPAPTGDPVNRAPVPIQFAQLGMVKPSRSAYQDESSATTKKIDPAEIKKRVMAKQQFDRSVSNKTGTATALPLNTLDDDDDEGHRTLKTMSLDDADVTIPEPQHDDEDDDDNELLGDDEEAMAAARKEAESRAARAFDAMQARQQAKEDVAMQDEDSEEDPLDAFMANLQAPEDVSYDPLKELRLGKHRPKGFFGDDEPEQEAVGDDFGDLGTMSKKKKKEIPTVDHSKMEYEPFRKDFYTQPQDIASLTEDELEALRLDLDNIKVSGEDPPRPITSFTQGGFSATILEVITQRGFTTPTPVQAQALPSIMSGRDTLAIAKTGSGKTMAYLLPLIRHVHNQRPVGNMEGPIALVLAPTRELSVQIFKDLKPFLAPLQLRAVCAYGGSSISEQIADLKRGAEIIVATPGRLIDLLAANSGRVTNLARVTYLVLDEADRMFDMGFEPQITRVINNIRPDRQTVLFSATFPKSMEALARKTQKNAIQIEVGGRSVVAADITQVVEVVQSKEDRFKRLLHFLGENHKADDGSLTLIFAEKQAEADDLLGKLIKVGWFCSSIHGGRDQVDRDQAIRDFKQGLNPIMIATSLAARGLDVKQLNLVINFEPANHREDYVHRCGRTGRAGNKGTAVTFVLPDQDKAAHYLVKCLKDSETAVPAELQVLADAFDEKLKSGAVKKLHNIGFGGRGIEHLEATRDNDRAQLQDRYNEDGEAKTVTSKKDAGKAEDISKMIANVTSGVQARDESTAKSADTRGESSELVSILQDALQVRKSDNAVAKKDATGPGGKKMTALERAAAAAARINDKVKGTGSRGGNDIPENRSLDAGAYHAVLRVNDLPQRARWAVTNRSNQSKILDDTGCSITSKGNYYAPGTEPGPGEAPKLYLLVEGDTSIIVEKAMAALLDHLKNALAAEETARANQPVMPGRYTV